MIAIVVENKDVGRAEKLSSNLTQNPNEIVWYNIKFFDGNVRGVEAVYTLSDSAEKLKKFDLKVELLDPAPKQEAKKTTATTTKTRTTRRKVTKK